MDHHRPGKRPDIIRVRNQPPVEKRPDYPVAKKVLGREGFVYSPYNNKIISVRDEQDRLLPSGTLVADPTFDESEKKYFRVP